MLDTQRSDVSDQRRHRAIHRPRLDATGDRPLSLVSARVIADNGRSSAFPILPLFLERRSSLGAVVIQRTAVAIRRGLTRQRQLNQFLSFLFHAVCMVAVGLPGRPADLPERLRSREVASERRALREIAFDGVWNEPFSTKGVLR